MTSRLRPWMFVSAAWIGPALLAIVSRMAQARLWGDPAPGVPQLLFESLDWLAYGFFAPAIFAISRRWPLSRTRAPWSHWAIHAFAAIAFCAAWAGAGTVLKYLLGTDRFEQGVAVSFASWFFITLPFGTGAYLGMVGIEHAIRHYTAARDWEARAERVSAQLVSARLAALQARLNPHFLFNSLNTIAVLVREGDPRAAAIVEQLSDVLRRTLADTGTAEVALGEELFLVREYLAVEEARFSDRLRPEFDVPDPLLTAAVPAFALQHLVENAIRHGVARRSEAGRIMVSARREGDTLVLTVIDDGFGIEAGRADVEGHGLADTRARLQALYGERAAIAVRPGAGGGTVAELRLPWRETTYDREELDDA